jgi:EAL domain-containing protein (putative c-di-GMP-specific phosphodiesterase class I)
MLTCFKTEKIINLQDYGLTATDLLFQSNIPNSVLFNNEETHVQVEHYILHRVDEMLEKELLSPDKMYILNISVHLFMHESYYKHLLRLPDNIKFDINAFDQLSNQHVLNKLVGFKDRIILDGFGKGNANHKTLEFLQPSGVKFDRIMLSSNDETIYDCLIKANNISELVVFTKIESFAELERVKNIGFVNGHGYYIEGRG